MNFCFYLQNRLIQTSQTAGEWSSDTSPCSIPWFDNSKIFQASPVFASKAGTRLGCIFSRVRPFYEQAVSNLGP